MGKKTKAVAKDESTEVLAGSDETTLEAQMDTTAESDQVAQPEVPVVETPVSDEVPQDQTEASEQPVEEPQVEAPVEAPAVVEAPVETPAPVEVPVAKPAAKPVFETVQKKKQIDGTKQKSEEELYLDNIRENGTMEQKRILIAVEDFASRMVPKADINPAKGAGIQQEFLEHLLWALRKDYEIFRGCWNVLLVYFALYHGVNSVRNYTALSEYSTMRFLFAWTKGADKCSTYGNLITLLRATRHKDTRKHDIKTISLDKIGVNVFGEKEINNLKQFYEV